MKRVPSHPLQDQIEGLLSRKTAGVSDTLGRDVALLGGHGTNVKTGEDFLRGVTQNGQAFHRYSDGRVVVLDQKAPPQGKLGYLLAKLQSRPVK